MICDEPSQKEQSLSLLAGDTKQLQSARARCQLGTSLRNSRNPLGEVLAISPLEGNLPCANAVVGFGERQVTTALEGYGTAGDRGVGWELKTASVSEENGGARRKVEKVLGLKDVM